MEVTLVLGQVSVIVVLYKMLPKVSFARLFDSFYKLTVNGFIPLPQIVPHPWMHGVLVQVHLKGEDFFGSI